MIKVNYTLLTTDKKFNQIDGNERFCNCSKTFLVKKCLTSLLESIDYVAIEKPESFNHLRIYDDSSSDELLEYINKCIKHFSKSNFLIELIKIDGSTLAQATEIAYRWMGENPASFVFHSQDDFLYCKTAIYEMICMWYQIKMYDADFKGTEPILQPINHAQYWLLLYNARPTPRTIVISQWRYWIQSYDLTCCFLTNQEQFNRHWPEYEKYFQLLPKGTEEEKLEPASLTRIYTRKGVLGLMPIYSLMLHIQGGHEADPHIDWKEWWDKIKLLD